jgi:hypothetical protein
LKKKKKKKKKKTTTTTTLTDCTERWECVCVKRERKNFEPEKNKHVKKKRREEARFLLLGIWNDHASCEWNDQNPLFCSAVDADLARFCFLWLDRFR